MTVVAFTERYGARENRGRDVKLFFLHEALTQCLIRSNAVRRTPELFLELGDGFLDEAQLLIRNAEVVMTLVVLVVDVFGDTLLEPLEHLLEVGLLITRRWLLFCHHARRLRILSRS